MFTNGSETLSHTALQNRLKLSFPANKPPVGWSVYVPPEVPDETAEEFLEQKKEEIRRDAELTYNVSVTDVDGNEWNGGFDSALKIKSVADMAEFIGETEIGIYDINNTEHVVTLTKAKEVAAEIGAAFQVKLAAKQTAMRTLTGIDLQAADAKDQISAVTLQSL